LTTATTRRIASSIRRQKSRRIRRRIDPCAPCFGTDSAINTPVDDDRGDRFDDLDVNRDGSLNRREFVPPR
jgi:hypothetical protein